MSADEKLWGVREVAEYLGVPVQTVYQWRATGYGPTGARVGRYVRYRPEDVRAWVATLIERAA